MIWYTVESKTNKCTFMRKEKVYLLSPIGNTLSIPTQVHLSVFFRFFFHTTIDNYAYFLLHIVLSVVHPVITPECSDILWYIDHIFFVLVQQFPVVIIQNLDEFPLFPFLIPFFPVYQRSEDRKVLFCTNYFSSIIIVKFLISMAKIHQLNVMQC